MIFHAIQNHPLLQLALQNDSLRNQKPVLSEPLRVKNPSLLARINWVFAYYLAFGGYFVHQLYQAYQVKFHPSYGLTDQLKLYKCEALLNEADKNLHYAPLLRSECEALLATIQSNDNSKDKLLLRLIECSTNLENSAEHVKQLYLQLSSPSSLVQAAKIIWKHVPRDQENTKKLVSLFEKAVAKINDSTKSILVDLSTIRVQLEFGEIFFSLDRNDLAIGCTEKALENAKRIAALEIMEIIPLKAFCEIVKSCHKMKQTEQMVESLTQAQQHLNGDKFEGNELIEAHLVFAETLFSFGDERLQNEITILKNLMDKDPSITSTHLYSFTKLLSNINMQEAKNWFEVYIEKVLKGDMLLPEFYLSVILIYQEKLIEDSGQNKKLWITQAYRSIENMPEEFDEARESKIDSIIKLLDLSLQGSDQFQETSKELILCLEKLYRDCPLDSLSVRWEKSKLGKQILMFYDKMNLDKMNLIDEFDSFSSQYLEDLQEGTDAGEKIDRLVRQIGLDDSENFKSAFGKKGLEVAESLLSQANSLGVFQDKIIRKYLLVDHKRSLTLIKQYKDEKANHCLKIAVAIFFFIGVGHFYPKFIPYLSWGIFSWRLVSHIG